MIEGNGDMLYKIVQCPKCTCIQITSGTKNMKCVSCYRQTSLDRVKKEGCFYDSYQNPLYASDYCKAIKMKFKGKFRLKNKKYTRNDNKHPLD